MAAGLTPRNNVSARFCAAAAAAADPTTDANPWWTVDLGEQVTVRGVLVTARSDISWNQLGFTQVSNGEVTVGGGLRRMPLGSRIA